MPSILAILAAFLLHSPISVDYTLHVDTADLSTFDVTMRIRNAPDTFTIAAAAHPEYDDKYWHYIEGMTVQNGTVERADSVLWRVRSSGREVTVRYRVQPPAVEGLRPSWRAYLTPTGGLVGGPHAFLYVLGAESSRATVTLQLPRGWSAATGLHTTNDPAVFTATNVDTLIDSPIVVGRLREWRFDIQGVPHHIVYLGMPTGVQFDTAAFRSGIETLARATVAFWGSMPYSSYTFILEDGAFEGGLEHVNSVTLGAPSATLAKNPTGTLRELAHEFIHTWNLMRMKPIEYRSLDYRAQPPVTSLWFSEGLTIFYADLLRRRAGLPVEEPAREAHLAGLIARYLSNPGYARFSAEMISRAEYNRQPPLGSFAGSSHLLGEVLGSVLDIAVRDATNGRRSMDDVMRLMLERSATSRGFTGRDIENAVATVCACNVSHIFDEHVRGASELDFNAALAPLGLRATVEWKPAANAEGAPLPDMRIRGSQTAPGLPMRLYLFNPETIWVRAGLHMNDELETINGTAVTSWPQMRSLLGAMKIGDTAHLEIRRAGAPLTVVVPITGYDVPHVVIEEVANASEKQRQLREAWRAGR
jgi:predicted metalloprotease with PDZ domain